MIGDGGNLDDEQLVHNIIYACIFCFTQDIPNDVKIRMEIKIRSIYELRNVPVQHSIYEHFYDRWMYNLKKECYLMFSPGQCTKLYCYL